MNSGKWKPTPPPKPRISTGNGSNTDNPGSTPADFLLFAESSYNQRISEHSLSTSASDSSKHQLQTKEKTGVSSIRPYKHTQTSPNLVHSLETSPQFSPKPALLPKPKVTVVGLPSALKRCDRKPARGNLIPQHPDVVLSSEKPVNGRTRRLSPTSQANQSANAFTNPVRAPVAKLDEFEGLVEKQKSGNPVRPPRTRKNKTLPNCYFSEFVEIKPAIPAKKRQLLLQAEGTTGADQSTVKKDFQDLLPLTKFYERKIQNPCPGIPNYEVKVKSASLGRYIEPPSSLHSPELEERLWDPSDSNNSGPLRPPRRGRKKFSTEPGRVTFGHILCRSISLFDSVDDAEKNIPIYAVVNYNLKRNRREAMQSSSIEVFNSNLNLQGSICLDANSSKEFLQSRSIFEKQKPCDSNDCNSLVLPRYVRSAESLVQTSPLSRECTEKVNTLDGVIAAISKDSSERDKSQTDNLMGNTESRSFTSSSKPSNSIVSSCAVQNKPVDLCSDSIKLIETSSKIESVPVVDSSKNVESPKQKLKVAVGSQTIPESIQQEQLLHKDEPETLNTTIETYLKIEDDSDKHESDEKSCDAWSVGEACEDNSYASSKQEYFSAKASIHSSMGDIMLEDEECTAPANVEELKFTEHQESGAEKNLSEIFQNTDRSIENAKSFIESREQQNSDPGKEITGSDLVNEVTVSQAGDINSDQGEQDNNPTDSSTAGICSSSSKQSLKVPSNCDTKRSSLSPERTYEVLASETIDQQHYFRDQSLWCDEGDLSTGALGDVDSSDAARQSSFDETGGSDNEDLHLPHEPVVKRKISSIIPNITKNMLRKSWRKSKDKKDLTQSQFYCNPSNSSEVDDNSVSDVMSEPGLSHTSPVECLPHHHKEYMPKKDVSTPTQLAFISTSVATAAIHDLQNSETDNFSGPTEYFYNVGLKTPKKEVPAPQQPSNLSTNISTTAALEDLACSEMDSISCPTEGSPCLEKKECPKETVQALQKIASESTSAPATSLEDHLHSETDNDEDFRQSVPDVSYINLHSSVTEAQKQQKKAFQIAEEIMTSEKVFVDVLNLLCTDFRGFVEVVTKESKHPIISELDLSKILNHLPQILKLNEDLLHDLCERIENWETMEKIADVIVKKGPFLKLYTSYIQSFESQCNYLDECCQKNASFCKVVKDFESMPRCQKLSIKHYMLKPVQRVPQYRLLLESYLRCLRKDSPDFQDTQTALQIVCEVADHANRSMKEGDALSRLLQLQSLLSGHYELIKPGRRLLREGELRKLSRKGLQPRYFILLNDCLLYTTYIGSGRSSGLKMNYELPLASMKVTVSSTKDYENEFSIFSVARSFTLCASSIEEMQDWVKYLQDAIKERASKQSTFLSAKLTNLRDLTAASMLGKEAPVWIPDERVTMCQSCTAEFTVTFRRHHCRACGRVFCGDCSANKAPLQYKNFQISRVCNDCFNSLLSEFEDPSFSLPDGICNESRNEIMEVARSHFKKAMPVTNKKKKKFIPQRLKEVCANDAGCQMSGWLQRMTRRSWKRMWFVLKEQVLYVYKASEDVVALESIPVLGYEVKTITEEYFQMYEGVEAKLVFKLTHVGQAELVFHADNLHSTQRWIQAMQGAIVL